MSDLEYNQELMNILKGGYHMGFCDGFNLAMLFFLLLYTIGYFVILFFILRKRGSNNDEKHQG